MAMTRFDMLAKKLSTKRGVTNPDALAAAIGRKKYGKAGMEKLADEGRKKAS